MLRLNAVLGLLAAVAGTRGQECRARLRFHTCNLRTCLYTVALLLAQY